MSVVISTDLDVLISLCYYRRSGDAESAPVTVADGLNTHGVLNQHPNVSQTKQDGAAGQGSSSSANTGPSFRVGISEDPNKRWRRAMEDAHAFVYDFGDVQGQGFFGIFDGHAGKDAAEWCGQNFHQVGIRCCRGRIKRDSY